jgi:hypothetical protein
MLPLSFRLEAARRNPSPRKAVLGQWVVARKATAVDASVSGMRPTININSSSRLNDTHPFSPAPCMPRSGLSEAPHSGSGMLLVSFRSTLAHILPRIHTSDGMVSSLKKSTGEEQPVRGHGQLVTVWMSTGSTCCMLGIEARTSRGTVVKPFCSLRADVSWVIARGESSDIPVPRPFQIPQGPSFRTGNAPSVFRPPMEWTAY